MQQQQNSFANGGTRVDELIEQSQYSKYIVLPMPTKFKFNMVVRIFAVVLSFIDKCRGKFSSSVTLSGNSSFKFSVFVSVNMMLENREPVNTAPLLADLTGVDILHTWTTVFSEAKT